MGLSRTWVLDLQWSQYQDVGEEGETGVDDVESISATMLYRFGR